VAEQQILDGRHTADPAQRQQGGAYERLLGQRREGPLAELLVFAFARFALSAR
jgi:hypothetical protein